MMLGVPQRKRVLIVEDDTTLRELFRWALVAAGFAVSEASNGLDALQSIDGNPPDAVVLDLGLPLVSGFDVRRELAAGVYTRTVPVVVVTGSTEVLADFDAACILRKPVGPEELIAAVKNCISAGPRRGA
jgi:DNA-binding response OmpR family regulator